MLRLVSGTIFLAAIGMVGMLFLHCVTCVVLHVNFEIMTRSAYMAVIIGGAGGALLASYLFPSTREG